MPPPTGVVSGPLMPTRYSRNASSVSSGSQFAGLLERLLAGEHFEPLDLRAAAVRLRTAASNTRTLARQMSGPVPSPSMNGMIGLIGHDESVALAG